MSFVGVPSIIRREKQPQGGTVIGLASAHRYRYGPGRSTDDIRDSGYDRGGSRRERIELDAAGRDSRRRCRCSGRDRHRAALCTTCGRTNEAHKLWGKRARRSSGGVILTRH
jgi:hypothetical protein